MDDSISINKYVSRTGLCSRREADRWIEAGRVLINGKRAKKGNRVSAQDEVIVDGSIIQKKAKAVYLAFHKPIGVTCTTDPSDKTNIISYINYPERIFPIGRLDKESSGLILLTNNGDIVNKILRVENNHEKEYIVSVNRSINNSFIKQMSKGIPILGTITQKCEVETINKTTFKIVLKQGLNRQIRRMCEYLGYKVVGLHRVRIMDFKLERLKPGHWRKLSSGEIDHVTG